MTSDAQTNGHEGAPARVVACPTMQIVVDPGTGLPSFTCTAGAIGFWQMMVGEVMRQLEEQRRIAAMQKLQEAARDAALMQSLSGRR